MTNIAELLKDAPNGMKLYSPLFGEVTFKYINDSKFGVVVEDSEGCCRSFDKYGRYFTVYNNAEYLLFPSKDCRTWQGWTPCVDPKFKVGDWITDGNITIQIEDIRNNSYMYSDGVLYSTRIADKVYHLWSIADIKDGDVLCTYECGEPKIVFINRLIRKNGSNIFMYYCFYNIMYPKFDANDKPGCLAPKREDVKPATKEQRDLLFAKMREAGYEWDAEKKELKKIQPHYNIANFQPFDKVLCRGHNRQAWRPSLYGCYDTSGKYPMFVCATANYLQCIPYNDDTKHLLGTTDMPSEEYINW